MRFEIVLLEHSEAHGKAYLMPVSASKSRYVANDAKKTIQLRNIGAFEWLAYLLIYERLEYWGGRCNRCNRFFVKNSLRQKRYCSKQCGANKTSKEWKRKQTSDENAKKRANVLTAIAKYWGTSRKKKDAEGCRAYVIENVENTTHNWLTRQASAGLLDLAGGNAPASK